VVLLPMFLLLPMLLLLLLLWLLMLRHTRLVSRGGMVVVLLYTRMYLLLVELLHAVRLLLLLWQ
jgi:hypothetical protein